MLCLEVGQNTDGIEQMTCDHPVACSVAEWVEDQEPVGSMRTLTRT